MSEYVDALEDLADKVKAWNKTRTEYLTLCEIGVSALAPVEGSERYRKEAAESSFAASEMVAALQRLEKLS